ncbi:NADH-quinone oxidoreductase subunit J [bacterium]|nr:MAG: NADH-quinone oxidoreductase subunit J [bacterium]
MADPVAHRHGEPYRHRDVARGVEGLGRLGRGALLRDLHGVGLSPLPFGEQAGSGPGGQLRIAHHSHGGAGGGALNGIQIGGLALTPELGLVSGLAGMAALCAVGVVAFNSAIRSALCLVMNFFLLAVLYFTLSAETVGITQIVVYTGAIMVLFLFVIMLLNIGAPAALGEEQDWKRPVGILLGVALFTLVGSQILPGLISVTRPATPDVYGQPQAIGRAIFSLYVVPFEAVSVLLMIGIVGSILLAKRKI